MTEEKKDNESSQEQESQAERIERIRRDASLALKEGVSSLQKDTNARKVFMGNVKTRWAWGYWAAIAVAILIYVTVIFLVVTHILDPLFQTLYAFTKEEADQIGIILEADLLSASFIGILAYLIGRRSGRKEMDYEKLRQLLKEDREALVKALKQDKGGESEK